MNSHPQATGAALKNAITPLGTGLWGVLATPFSGPDLAVDAESLRREVQLYAAMPAAGLVVLGVFGEGASLSSAEQALIVRTVGDEAGSTPIVVGLSSTSTAVAVEQAQTALGALGDKPASLMVQVNSANTDVLVGHLTAVHDATGAGIVVQDYPLASGVRVTSAQILAAVSRCPFVVAIKSEAPPTASAIADLTAETSVPVFGGLGGVGLLDELAAGASGAMTGFSHPEGLQDTLVAWAVGGYTSAREAFSVWLPLVNFEAQPGVALAVRKEILRRRGVIADAAVRPPAAPLPPQLAALMDAHLGAVASRRRF
jgi:4-hydroxy-tetrahydrodipicolinate synthase